MLDYAVIGEEFHYGMSNLYVSGCTQHTPNESQGLQVIYLFLLTPLTTDQLDQVYIGLVTCYLDCISHHSDISFMRVPVCFFDPLHFCLARKLGHVLAAGFSKRTMGFQNQHQSCVCSLPVVG